MSDIIEKNESTCESKLTNGSIEEAQDVLRNPSLVDKDSFKPSPECSDVQHCVESNPQDLIKEKELVNESSSPLKLPIEQLDQKKIDESLKAAEKETIINTITKEACAVTEGTTMKTDKDSEILSCGQKTPTETTVARKNSEKKGKSSVGEGGINLEQQNLMEESGKMMEYLRQEVLRLRSDNASLRSELETMNDNTKRLTEANSAARASFAALNEHTLAQRDNAAAAAENYERQIQDLKISQQEMRDELQMKNNAYISEFRNRLNYEEAMSRIIDTLQERCRDSRLVEDILQITDEVEEKKNEEEEEEVEESALELSSPETINEPSTMVGRLTSFFS